MDPVTPLEMLEPLDCDEQELSSRDLESIAILYDKIRQLYRNKALLTHRSQVHTPQRDYLDQ